jgi:DNA-binding response OmpR family regulator
VVDDDADIRDLVAFKLAQAGYEVDRAADGAGALAAVARRRPDLAILDVTMPGMSGIDLCRSLRADPETASVLVLLLTARAQERDVEAGFAAGADDYVVKPFSPRELVSRVEALLARARR